MKWGIQLSSVRTYMQSEASMRDTLCRLREIGYRIAQLQWHSPDIPPTAVADALRAADMEAVSVQDYTEKILSEPETFLRLADACALTDVCVSGIPAPSLTPDGVKETAEALVPLHRRLAADGRTLSFHPRWQELVPLDGGPDALTLLLAASDPSLRVVVDCSHAVRAGKDPAAFLRALSGRVDFIHCKDMESASREAVRLLPVGAGCVDWQPLIAAARQSGVRVAFAEQEKCEGDVMEAMAASLSYLRTL